MAYMYFYPPPPYHPLTYLGETFPEQHYPLEHTRHKIGHAVHDFFGSSEPDIHSPRVDVRESRTRYYIEVELPGLHSVDNMTIRWSNHRLIAIRGKIEREAVEEETAARSNESQDAESKDRPKEHPVHLIKKERRLGAFSRLFEFGVDVDHDSMKAHLQDGLLTISIDKKPHGSSEIHGREVKVEQGSVDA